MSYQVSETHHGFTVTRVRSNDEIRGTLVEMLHEKTGARLCWMDNNQENKLFGIAFKTIPTDNTGVFHILEHSVLCGSEKYRVREPFVELLKGSMNTFLNAMTAGDMTVYPVASRNDRDLMNLTEVYLDAVFAPRILEDENIFRQEGHHIEQAEDGSWCYKGVVFNEMKGAMSDCDQLVDRTMMSMLFPYNGYGYNSGGDPEQIPTLTYEQFLAAYRKHYHPSNARVYLDGAVPMEEMLPLLDSYFSRFEKTDKLPILAEQTPMGCERTVYYEINAEEPLENRGHYTVGGIVSAWDEPVRNMAIGVISDVIAGSNDAPLKKAVLQDSLAQDISVTLDDSIAQPYMTIHAENVTDGRDGEIMGCIRRVGLDIRDHGLDRDAMEASINRMAFRLKEEDEPQALTRGFRALLSWLYGGDPMMYLVLDPYVDEVRRMMDDGRLSALAAELLLREENLATLRTLPSHTVGEEKRAKEAEKLKAVTDAWTPEQVAENKATVAKLLAWQQTPDSAEELARLPMLKKEDADVAPQPVPTELTQEQGVRVMYHRLPTRGIVYLNLFFSLTDLSLDEIKEFSTVCTMLSELPTAAHEVLPLQQEIKKYTGRLEFTVRTYGPDEELDRCTPCFVVTAATLEENLPRTLNIIAEILRETRLDDTDRIRDMIMQCEMSARQRGVVAGHAVGMTTALSHFSAEAAVQEVLEGATAIRYIHRFAGEFDACLASFRAVTERCMKDTFCKKRLRVGITADDPVSLRPLLDLLPEGTAVPELQAYTAPGEKDCGYIIPAQIGYACKGYNLQRSGLRVPGSLSIATNILSLSYLWNTVRVQGGAYGCGIHVDRTGNIFSYSYRDPTPARTLGMDQGYTAFLKEFLAGDEGLDKYIISTLNRVNPLLTARARGMREDMRILSGITPETIERFRQEILHSTPEDLIACGVQLDAFAQHAATCVVAHKAALADCGGLAVSEL